MRIHSVLVVVACSLLGGWAQTQTVEVLDSPAGPRSGQPFVYDSDNRIYLSWQEDLGDEGHALMFSVWDGVGWSPAKTIASKQNFFINWADFPSILAMQDGSLVAHWLAKSGPHTYAYDVWVSRSRDGGDTWSSPLRPHRDGTQTEHGFVSLVDRGQGRFSAVWLDGRNFKQSGQLSPGEENEMALMFTTFANDAFEPEQPLDLRVCDCCQTTMVNTPNGLFVAYRDRSPSEVRDISYVRFVNGTWTKPQSLNEDGWEIHACPVNGPVAAAEGSRLAVIWYTRPDHTGRVRLKFSRNEGEDFGPAIEIDDTAALGRVDVAWQSDGSVLAVWMRQGPGKVAALMGRTARPDGSLGPPFEIAQTQSSRSSGFPRIAPGRDAVFVAWTELEPVQRVRIARVTAP